MRRRSQSFLLLIALACGAFPASALGQDSAVPTASASAASASDVPAGATILALNGDLAEAANRLLESSASGPAPSVKRVAPNRHAPEPLHTPPTQATAPRPMEGSGGTGRALARVEQLRPMMEPILRRQGIPSALLAVVLVESGGRIAALSPKGARGVWQLMPETARHYGLLVSGERDERLDPVLATKAAARYLHYLYEQFGDWELALSAYNAGEQAVQKAIQQAGSRRFSVLSQHRLLPAETRAYVPDVLLASREFGHLASKSTAAAPDSARENVVFASAESAPAWRLPPAGGGHAYPPTHRSPALAVQAID